MHCNKTSMSQKLIRFASAWTLVLLLAPAQLSAQTLFKKETRFFSPGDSATFMLTNKFSSFFYGEIGQFATRGFQGFNVETEEYLEDYILLRNGQIMLRSQAHVESRSDRLIRIYPDSLLIEEVILLDSANVLQIKLTASEPCEIAFLPALGGSGKSSDFIYDIDEGESHFSAALKKRLGGGEKGNLPKWLNLATKPAGRIVQLDPTERKKFAARFNYPATVPVRITMQVTNFALIQIEIGEKRSQTIATNGEH